MQRITRGLVMAVAVAGFLGVASPSFAASKIECSISKDGKQSTQMVDTRDACTKLGGTVAMHPKASSTMPAKAAPKAKSQTTK